MLLSCKRIIIMNIYERIGVTSNVAIAVISLALMLFLGFLMTRITKKLRLPNVTAYITVGILIGPYVLNLIPEQVVSGMDFLPDIALAFIAFSTGEYFKVSTLKKNSLKVIVITILESLLATVAVFLVTRYILNMSLSFSIVLSALAAATALGFHNDDNTANGSQRRFCGHIDSSGCIG